VTADIESLVLEHLRAIRATLATHGERLERMEIRLGSLEQYQALFHTDMATANVHLDHIAKRIERIERRLELTEPAP